MATTEKCAGSAKVCARAEDAIAQAAPTASSSLPTNEPGPGTLRIRRRMRRETGSPAGPPARGEHLTEPCEPARHFRDGVCYCRPAAVCARSRTSFRWAASPIEHSLDRRVDRAAAEAAFFSRRAARTSRRRCSRGAASAAPLASVQAFAAGTEILAATRSPSHAAGMDRSQAQVTAATPSRAIHSHADPPAQTSVVQGSPSSQLEGSAASQAGTARVVVVLACGEEVVLEDELDEVEVDVEELVLDVELVDVEVDEDVEVDVDVEVDEDVDEDVLEEVEDEDVEVLVVDEVVLLVEVELDVVVVLLLDDDDVLVELVDVVVGSVEVVVEPAGSVEELLEDVVGVESVVLVDEESGVAVVDVVVSGGAVVGVDDDVVVSGTAVVDVEDDVVEELLVDDEEDDVVVVVEVEVDDVVPPKNEAKPAIWTMVSLAAVTSSQVLTNSESGCSGSNTRPIGGLANPSANSACVGVLLPPSGRPVAGSMTTRQISLLAKLV